MDSHVQMGAQSGQPGYTPGVDLLLRSLLRRIQGELGQYHHCCLGIGPSVDRSAAAMLLTS